MQEDMDGMDIFMMGGETNDNNQEANYFEGTDSFHPPFGEANYLQSVLPDTTTNAMTFNMNIDETTGTTDRGMAMGLHDMYFASENLMGNTTEISNLSNLELGFEEEEEKKKKRKKKKKKKKKKESPRKTPKRSISKKTGTKTQKKNIFSFINSEGLMKSAIQKKKYFAFDLFSTDIIHQS